jgi:hypothetical protein
LTKPDNPVEYVHVVKKPRSMTRLCVDPIKPMHVEPNFDITLHTYDSLNVVADVKTSEKLVSENMSLDNPRSDQTLGDFNPVVDDVNTTINESVHVSPTKNGSYVLLDSLTNHDDNPVVDSTK